MSLPSPPPAVLELPHRSQPLTQGPVHIIYYLHDSLPAEREAALRKAYETDLAQLRRRISTGKLGEVPGVEEHPYLSMEKARLRELHQRRFDAELDHTTPTGINLTETDIRDQLLHHWKLLEQAGEVHLHAICVMPNHVHLLASHPDPFERRSLLPLLEKHKRATTRSINHLLHRKRQRVWAGKAFERAVRPGTFNKIFWEVLHNPVRAGLAGAPSNYPGNYWHPEMAWAGSPSGS
ncbi:transposase [Lewinella sp. W8]|uniref:transposase n=1 Tax=Lewinella sp. W8 TaxID=2528208 RepID=UPI001563ED39|nr:transposase [Lewinella sp. W8]